MAKRVRKNKNGSPKFSEMIYLSNEQEIFDWAKAVAEKVPIEKRKEYYRKLQPPDVVKLLEEMRLLEQKSTDVLRGIIQTGIQAGFITMDPSEDPQQVMTHMETYYLPKAKSLRIGSINFLYHELENYGQEHIARLSIMGADWDSLTYQGSKGKWAIYSINHVSGERLGEIWYDGSKKVFEIWV